MVNSENTITTKSEFFVCFCFVFFIFLDLRGDVATVQPWLLIQAKSEVDMAILPPCKDLLYLYIDYCVAIYKRAHLPYYESPRKDDGHRLVNEGDILESKWTSQPIMPPSIVNLIEQVNEDFNDEEIEDESEDIMEYMFENDVDDVE